jgi:hypothetical protein
MEYGNKLEVYYIVVININDMEPVVIVTQIQDLHGLDLEADVGQSSAFWSIDA